MKKFTFTLRKLYDVKQSEEKQKRIELKELNRTMQQYKKQRKESEDLFNGQQDIYRKKCKDGMSMLEVKFFGDYFQFLMKEMKKQDLLIEGCQKSIDDCTACLTKLLNEEKVLDRMYDEQYQEYLAELQKDNDKLIEDFMQARH